MGILSTLTTTDLMWLWWTQLRIETLDKEELGLLIEQIILNSLLPTH